MCFGSLKGSAPTGLDDTSQAAAGPRPIWAPRQTSNSPGTGNGTDEATTTTSGWLASPPADSNGFGGGSGSGRKGKDPTQMSTPNEKASTLAALNNAKSAEKTPLTESEKLRQREKLVAAIEAREGGAFGGRVKKIGKGTPGKDQGKEKEKEKERGSRKGKGETEAYHDIDEKGEEEDFTKPSKDGTITEKRRRFLEGK